MNDTEISKLIVKRLQSEAEKLRAEFQQPRSVPTHYIAIDNVLPEPLAEQIFAVLPAVTNMRLLSSFRERKYTSKTVDKMDPLIAATVFAFQSREMIKQVAFITGLQDMKGDPHLYAGGISTMLKGHFVNPHIDNSHDSARQLYRVLNLLYYVTPGWRNDDGGNLELWNERVKERTEIPSLFNRLVIMETNCQSWHSVSRVKTCGRRCCISNYYFSPHPPGGKEHFHITCFKARPEQHVLAAITEMDTALRKVLRKAVKKGVGRDDLYEGQVK